MNAEPAHTRPAHMEPLIQYLLEASMQQQQLTGELAHSLQAVTQELLHCHATEGSSLPCFSDSHQEAHHLLSKLGPHDNGESYFFLFEQTTLKTGPLGKLGQGGMEPYPGTPADK